MEFVKPDPPEERGSDLEGDGASVRSGATAGADGDLPDQTPESAATTSGPSPN